MAWKLASLSWSVMNGAGATASVPPRLFPAAVMKLPMIPMSGFSAFVPEGPP